MAGTLASIFVRLGFVADAAAIDKVQTRLQAFSSRMESAGKSIASFGGQMQKIGVVASAAIALPVAGAAAAG